jgi:hypothetical protein
MVMKSIRVGQEIIGDKNTVMIKMKQLHSATAKMLFIGIFSYLVICSSSFSTVTSSTSRRNGASLMASFGSTNDGSFPPKRGQEKRMEMSSIAGAKAISKLNINERTKRAMLAEAVEDRIFEIMDELEDVINRNDGVLEGDEKEEAVELARQTKALQVQYDDIVNGRPSHLLNLGNDKRFE